MGASVGQDQLPRDLPLATHDGRSLGVRLAENVAGAEWLKAQVPHGTLRVLAEHGHFVAFELWDEVLDSLGV